MVERISADSNLYFDDVKTRFVATIVFFGICLKDIVFLVAIHQHFPAIDYYSAWFAIFVVSAVVESFASKISPQNFFSKHVSSFPLVWFVYLPENFSVMKPNLVTICDNLQLFFVLMILMNFVYSAIGYIRSVMSEAEEARVSKLWELI